MAEKDCGHCMFTDLRDNYLRVVDQLSVVTSGRVRLLTCKYSKDASIQNSRFIPHRMTS